MKLGLGMVQCDTQGKCEPPVTLTLQAPKRCPLVPIPTGEQGPLYKAYSPAG
jgi:hypothetical protein